MEKSTSSSSVWENFFIRAGIMPDRVTKYSTIFLENRIKPGMLGDLDKQVLKEVGIIAVGDVISILRYAKILLEQGGFKFKDKSTGSGDQDEIKLQNKDKEEEGRNLISAPEPPPPRPTPPPPPSSSQVKSCITKKRCHSPPAPPPSLMQLKIEAPGIRTNVDEEDVKRARKSAAGRISEMGSTPVRKEPEKKLKLESEVRPFPFEVEKVNKKDSSTTSRKKSKKDKKKHSSPKHKSKSKKKDKSKSPRRRKHDDPYYEDHTRDRRSNSNNFKSSHSSSKNNYRNSKYSDARQISDETVTSSSSKPNKLPSPVLSEVIPVTLSNKNEEHGVVGIGYIKPNYVMIYRLNEKREWKEEGMGSVTFSQGTIKCACIENASRVLLESEIKKDTLFENSNETFMSWTNSRPESAPGSEDAHGLRFKEKPDFHFIWSQCKEYLGGSITKYNEEGGPRNGLSFGLASMQGWCSVMEDTHSTWISLPGRLKSCSLFSIFDGHAGSLTSTFAADNLLECIVDGDVGTGNLTGSIESEISSTLRSAHLILDRRCRMNNAKGDVEDKSGSTSVSLFITPDFLFISNLGDSRALLCSEGKVIFATDDHKPGRSTEFQRIEAAGGTVTATGKTKRINGDLSVSRGFGDFRYKTNSEKGVEDQIVSPDPEITSFPRRAYSSDSDFIVLASDGIWDVMRNEEVATFVQKGMDEGLELKGICNRMLDFCLVNKESRDNMSMILVKLHKEEG